MALDKNGKELKVGDYVCVDMQFFKILSIMYNLVRVMSYHDNDTGNGYDQYFCSDECVKIEEECVILSLLKKN